MTDFKKFHSIENTYRKEFIEKILSSPCSKEEWCVTEKVHGANFSFTCNGTEVLPAKRTSYLENEELNSFYNCSKMVKENQGKISDIYVLMIQKYPDINSVTVFGELFGGSYPGIKGDYKAIQTGIRYHPMQQFCAFDIRVRTGTNPHFLNYDEAISLFEKVGLFYAKILYRGSFHTCLEWSEKNKSTNSTIPDLFGLPPVKENMREGHVLKPLNPTYTHRGEPIVLKDKNDKFNEKREKKEKIESKQDQSDVENAVTLVTSYITQNRYDAVVSKHGPDLCRRENSGKLIGLITQDALIDFKKDRNIQLKREQVKEVNKRLSCEVRKMVLELYK